MRNDASHSGKPGTKQRIHDTPLLAHIRAIHAEVKGEYGWPRMWKELQGRDVRVGKERVRRLMKLHGIQARTFELKDGGKIVIEDWRTYYKNIRPHAKQK